MYLNAIPAFIALPFLAFFVFSFMMVEIGSIALFIRAVPKYVDDWSPLCILVFSSCSNRWMVAALLCFSIISCFIYRSVFMHILLFVYYAFCESAKNYKTVNYNSTVQPN
jgi:hypothetical protein